MKTALTLITTTILLMGCQSNATLPQEQGKQQDYIVTEADGSYSVYVYDGPSCGAVTSKTKAVYKNLKYAEKFDACTVVMTDKNNKKSYVQATVAK